MSKLVASTYWTLVLVCFFSINSIEAVWSPAVTLSSQTADESQIGIDAAGNAISIWREFDGINTNIQSSTLAKGGSWSAPVTISSAPGNNLQATPQIAVNPVGDAVVVWEELAGASSTVKAAMLPVGGEWSSSINISTPTTRSGQLPQIAINASGRVVAVWQRYDGSRSVTEGATLQFGGTWSSPVGISPLFTDAYMPQVAIDNAGNAVAVWVDVTSQTIQTASLPFEGNWSSAVNLSDAGGTGEPQVAMNANGYAVATWQRFPGSFCTIQASTMQFGNSWSIPVDISAVDADAFESEIAVDANGNILAVWYQMAGSDVLIQSASLPFEGTWTIPVTLSSAGVTSYDPRVAFDAAGNAIVVWDRDNGYDMIIQAAMLPVGGVWSEPYTLSTNGQGTIFPRIAVDSTGYIVVNWVNNTLGVIQAAEWTPVSVVTDVSPNVSLLSGGDSITITGTNFSNVTSINFGSIGASFATISPTEIIAIAPPGSEGTVDVTVTTIAGTSSIVDADRYTYRVPSAPLATIVDIHPNGGSAMGGSLVRIVGTNFIDVTQVSFGSMQAKEFTVFSPTLIMAIAPPGSSTVDVTVTNQAGTSATSYRDRYTYRSY